MKLGDAALALLTAVAWGLTFVAIKIGLRDAPPFLLSALRFAFAAFPAVLFVRPPRAPFGLVALYGLLIGVGQFGLLFTAIRLGMPAGLSALVIHLQAFFTIALSWAAFGEVPTRRQLVTGGLAFAGLAVIGVGRAQGADFLPFALTVAAAMSWSLANLVGKRIGRVDALALTVWSSLAPPAPMLALSLTFEGPGALAGLAPPPLRLVIVVAILAYAGTLFGFGVWARLLARYPAAVVAPFALLTPVVAMSAARVAFGEPTSAIEWTGAVLVMAGLGGNVLGAGKRRPPPPEE